MSVISTCHGTTDDTVQHFLQLGVVCDDFTSTSGKVTAYDDYLFECGDEASYEVIDGRYTCSTTNVLKNSEIEPLDNVTVHTDFRWSNGAYEDCYGFVPDPSTVFEIPNLPINASEAEPCSGDDGEGNNYWSIPSGSDCPEPDPVTQPPTGSTTFFVDYVARFQRVVDDGCDSPTEEVVLIVCDTGEIVNIETNSDAITCTPSQDYDGAGQYSVCELECSDDDQCDELYIDRNPTPSVFSETHAEIKYRCQSKDVNGVDATYMISGSETTGVEGYCDSEEPGKQNLLLAQLNVMCPNSTGEMSYSNNDAYSECDIGIFSLDVNGYYTCLEGRFCDEEDCEVPFDDLVVQADHHRFQECIQTDDGSPAPLPESFTKEKEQGQYTAQFQVGSEFLYDENVCTGAKTGIRMTCENGGTITLVSFDADKDCEVVSNNEIECTELESSAINQAVDVAVYVRFLCIF